jgi:hypothetical protein
MEIDPSIAATSVADMLNEGKVEAASVYLRAFARDCGPEKFAELNQALAFRLKSNGAEVVVEIINGKTYWVVEKMSIAPSTETAAMRPVDYMDVVAMCIDNIALEEATPEKFRIAANPSELPEMLRRVRTHDETVANELSILHLKKLAADALTAHNVAWAAYIEREIAFLELATLWDYSNDPSKASRRLRDARIALQEAQRLERPRASSSQNIYFQPEELVLEQQLKSMGDMIRQ